MELFVRAANYELITLSWSMPIYKALKQLLNKDLSDQEVAEWQEKNSYNFRDYAGHKAIPSSRNLFVGPDYIMFYADGKFAGNYTYYITLKPGMPVNDDLTNISEAKLLLPTENIPKLYFYKAYYMEESHITKDLAPYKWFIDALDHFFRVNITDDAFKQDLSEFIEAHKSTFDSIRRSFTISEPKILGFGNDGIAFDIGDKVLKIFTREIPYEDAIAAWNRLHKHPELAKTEAMIYEVGQFKDISNLIKRSGPLYYYIIEKMIPLQDVLIEWQPFEEFIDDLQGKLIDDDVIHSLRAKMLNPKMDKVIKLTVKYLVKKYSKDLAYYKYNLEFKDKSKLQEGWFEELVEEVIMKEISRDNTDLQSANIGITPYGKLRFFDPSY